MPGIEGPPAALPAALGQRLPATRRSSVALLLALGFAAHRARAEGGYFVGAKGARASGRAGAYTVKADDLTAVVYNPAGLVRHGGNELTLGNRFAYHGQSFRREPTLDWGNTEDGVPPYVQFAQVDNQAPWQLLEPLVAVASDLGLPGVRLALSAMAPPGQAEQRFEQGGAQRYLMVSRKSQWINYAVSGAFGSADEFGLGVSLVWIQLRKLEYQLVIDGNTLGGQAHPVASELDMLTKISGSDPFTFNAVVGGWYRPLPYLEVGVSAQVVPATLKSQSHLSVQPLAIDSEVELERNGEKANDVSVELPLPLTARAGVRFLGLEQGRELFDIEVDLVYETWSRVERFEVATRGLTATLRGQSLSLDEIAIEKHWQDTLALHVGGDYQVVPERLSLRAGAMLASALAGPAYAHVDFPSAPRLGAGLGASVFLPRGVELALGYEVQRQASTRVSEGKARVYQIAPGSGCQPPYDSTACHPAYLGRPAPAVNAGSYRALSHMASLDVSYRF